MRSTAYVLSLDRCEHGNRAVSLDDEVCGTGTRLTPRLPCGCKKTQREHGWPLSERDLRGMLEEIDHAVCMLETDEDGRS